MNECLFACLSVCLYSGCVFVCLLVCLSICWVVEHLIKGVFCNKIRGYLYEYEPVPVRIYITSNFSKFLQNCTSLKASANFSNIKGPVNP